MITVTCKVCEKPFEIDVPQEIWDADLATRSEWAFNKIPASIMTGDLATSYAPTAKALGTIDANTEELLLYRLCQTCWEDESDD